MSFIANDVGVLVPDVADNGALRGTANADSLAIAPAAP
jgi:hypothetical protein